MLDFGALPPEVNSARMYWGPGSGPMMAAASAWDALAAQLDLYAAGYSSALSGLQGENWSGGASIAMAGAAAPYVAWATTTAVQAEQAATQARAAAAAYEAAFAATVPPEVVAANRIQLATLVATNFFGQNTMMIATTEAAYAEMWAQDAAAMYGYAASSSAAATLTPFSEPPQTTNAAGQSAQAAAMAQTFSTSTAGHTQATLSGLVPTVPQQLQALSTAGSSGSSTSAGSLGPTSLLSAFGDLNTLTGPENLAAAFSRASTSAGRFGSGFYRSDIQSGPNDIPFTQAGAIGAEPSGSGGVRGAVLARMGRAAPVGKLSVPQSWTAATPGTSLRAVPAGETNSPPGTSNGVPMTGMGPMTGMVGRPTGTPVLRNGRRRFTMPRPVFGG